MPKKTKIDPRYKTPTICLNMIVKDESAVIRRCLESVAPFIDYWVISDTGSTDGTQDLIREVFAELGVPGELREDAWRDFAHNRNVVLTAGKGKADYLLILDADDYFQTPEDFRFTNLGGQSYQIKMMRDGVDYFVPKLLRDDLAWRWEGVLHEHLVCDSAERIVPINYHGECFIHYTQEGARSQNADKYQRDADVLEKAVLDEPHNGRYRFYLAQSYRDSDQLEKAVENYAMRSRMGGFYEEVYYSLLEVGRCMQKLDYDPSIVVEAYMRAQSHTEKRLEGIYEAVKICRLNSWYFLGYRLGWPYRKQKLPKELSMFLDGDVYAWKFADELSVCAIESGRKKEGGDLLKPLLRMQDTIPPEEMGRIQQNYDLVTPAG